MSSAAESAMTPDVLKQRLGKLAIGGSREIRAIAELAAGEALAAVVVAIWRRRSWLMAASETGLIVARCPRVFGRRRVIRFPWSELTDVDTGAGRLTLTFGTRGLDLMAAPHDEFVRLIEAARRRLPGEPRPSIGELRELARRKLGRFMTFGLEPTIESLPDRLEPGEHVERLAGAKGEFSGLLVLTDRRLLLIDLPLRRGSERRWAVPRDAIRGAEPTDQGLLLSLDDGDVTLTEFIPPERRDEFAAVLSAVRS